MVETDTTTVKRRRSSAARRIVHWFLGAIALILISLFIVSFFLDALIRPRIEANMNRGLKGYHASLDHAHLQLLDFTLTLRDLSVVQLAHPQPPVAIFPLMRFQIDWKSLFFGRVVANVLIGHPRLHIDQAQLATERKDPTSLRQKGWQDALQNAYPFKINRFVLEEGDIVYVESGQKKPLHLSHLNLVSDNIRSIEAPNQLYPSWFRANMVLFDRGKVSLEGRANYLMQPFPGMETKYTVNDVPMDAVTTASQHINLVISGGTLASHGYIEYSPKVTNVDVYNATLEAIEVTYSHRPETANAEAKRIDVAGKTVEKETNRRAVNIDLRELEIKRSRLAFDDQAANPPFNLFISDTDLKVDHVVNHRSQGPGHFTLSGNFMGSGVTNATGTFLASGAGPEFNMKVSIENTDMLSLNPLLRAYGRFDVARGRFTLYSQLGVVDGKINGYVKPMFSDLKVYDYQKDKNKGVIGQAKQILIGAAAHVFKNRQTQQVATQVDISGSLKKANVSTWQAFVEIVENAFVKTILPGFDREVQSSSAENN
jgi:hypothetical protein